VTEFERINNASGAERWLALALKCVPVDHPGMVGGSLEEVLHQLRGVQRSSKYAHFVAVETSVDVAYGAARLPMRDNLTSATISMSVLPSRRRQGTGTALAKEILAFVLSEGRSNVKWTVGSPVGEESPGSAFSRVLGARKVLSRFRRELNLENVDDRELDTLMKTRVAARNSDYEIVTWVDRAPDDLVEDVATLVGRMSTDTPSGDLTFEPELWDTSRWREKEDDAFHSGRRRLAGGAVDRSGRLVAFTDIGAWAHEPAMAEQWNTIVAPDHRGHRLGLATKVANLRNLRREIPGVLRIETWNAVENSRMIAMNELLGYQVVERVDEYQLSV
jgi:GNAT superfamily N-acetyltransferase/RimJ/RimL family protein N-acetyltransferase